MVIGQEDAFLRREAAKENAKRDRRYERTGHGSDYEHTWHRPYENDGPAFVAPVERMRGDACVFTWKRRSQRATWVPADRPEYIKRDYAEVEDSIAVPVSKLFNVSAYTPGDFHMFFDDPRTRRKYLQWAPFLLSAENYHANPKKFAMRDVRHVQLGDAKSADEDVEDDEGNDED